MVKIFHCGTGEQGFGTFEPEKFEAEEEGVLEMGRRGVRLVFFDSLYLGGGLGTKISKVGDGCLTKKGEIQCIDKTSSSSSSSCSSSSSSSVLSFIVLVFAAFAATTTIFLRSPPHSLHKPLPIHLPLMFSSLSKTLDAIFLPSPPVS